MVDHVTDGVDSTCSDARISTLLVEACPIGRAVRIDDTFRILTLCSASNNAANSVRSAR